MIVNNAMSFETVRTISLITEAVALLAITLTLLNAFMDGYLVASVSKLSALFGMTRMEAEKTRMSYGRRERTRGGFEPRFKDRRGS